MENSASSSKGRSVDSGKARTRPTSEPAEKLTSCSRCRSSKDMQGGQLRSRNGAKSAPLDAKYMMRTTKQRVQDSKDSIHVNILRLGEDKLRKMELYYTEKERISVKAAHDLAERNCIIQLEAIRLKEREAAEHVKLLAVEKAVNECRLAGKKHEEFSLRMQREYLVQKAHDEREVADEKWRKKMADSVDRAVRNTERRVLQQAELAMSASVQTARQEERQAAQEELKRCQDGWAADYKRKTTAVEKSAKKKKEEMEKKFSFEKAMLEQQLQREVTLRKRAEEKLEAFHKDYEMYRRCIREQQAERAH